jgi:predicted Fe-Mo cluster-binding NifX family protein
MKIAIASTGESENSDLSTVFGRAPYFLIFENKKLAKIIKNPFTVGGGGAGPGSAQMLYNEGVEKVICAKTGQKAKDALIEKGIELIDMDICKVADALKTIKA